jgi:toxin ParE1/3/4
VRANGPQSAAEQREERGLSPDAEGQIVGLYEYVAARASPTIAESLASALVERCEQLGEMPLVGLARDDIRRGVRTTYFRKRVVIA